VGGSEPTVGEVNLPWLDHGRQPQKETTPNNSVPEGSASDRGDGGNRCRARAPSIATSSYNNIGRRSSLQQAAPCFDNREEWHIGIVVVFRLREGEEGEGGRGGLIHVWTESVLLMGWPGEDNRGVRAYAVVVHVILFPSKI
jgi:hypothetical protein